MIDGLTVRCPPEDKDAILSSDPETFFTDDHYRGFPAVLVRLDRIAERDLEALLTAARHCRTPRSLSKTIGVPQNP